MVVHNNGNGVDEHAFYFTYNLHMDPKYFSRLAIQHTMLGLGVLSGYVLAFNVLEDEFFHRETRGLANIVPKSGQYVEGVVYQIHLSDLNRLDQDAGVPDLKYYRKQVPICMVDNNHLLAYVYVGWPDCTSNGLRPSRTYLKQLLNAACHTRLSENFRQWLQNHPTCV